MKGLFMCINFPGPFSSSFIFLLLILYIIV
jgi:hypothetical protein